jgi:hypothetical protein
MTVRGSDQQEFSWCRKKTPISSFCALGKFDFWLLCARKDQSFARDI